MPENVFKVNEEKMQIICLGKKSSRRCFFIQSITVTQIGAFVYV